MSLFQNIALVNWANGQFMLKFVFGFVCLVLIGFVVVFVISGTKKKEK